jgi:hypothetical protein
MQKLPLLWVVASWSLLLGCESAEHKCATARSAALDEWNGYVQLLETARAKAAAVQRDSGVKLSGPIDKRLLPIAQQRANAKYNPGSEAWLRASQIALNDLCAADHECKTAKDDVAQAKSDIEDLDERLGLARAARDAARGDIANASKAASAAILHPEYPQLKQAQAKVAVLTELCAGLPVPKDETVSAKQP